MIDVEDFKASAARLLAKLPKLAAVVRARGDAHPRLEIEAGPVVIMAYASEDLVALTFKGLVEETIGRPPAGDWHSFQLDAEGNLLVGGKQHRVRRMEFDDARTEANVKVWPQFTNAKKVRNQS